MKQSSSPDIKISSETDQPLVGREEELTQLLGLLNLALAGRGQVAFVSGEGGVGKTRLIHEVGKLAARKGAFVVSAPSFEGENLIPYAPWIEAIHSVLRQKGKETVGRNLGPALKEVGRLVPELAARASTLGIGGWLSGPSESLGSTFDTERIRLFNAVSDFLIYQTEKTPLFLFFDDLQWADHASLQLFHFFCRRIKERRVMVAAAFRETELGENHPLIRMIPDLSREKLSHSISLKRLTANHVGLLMVNRFQDDVVAPEFIELVYSRTGGNPYFVEELLRSLTDDKRLLKSARGWTLRQISQVEIPLTVKSVIGERITRLGADSIQILATGAAIGMNFDYELVREVLGGEDERLIGVLEAAVRAGLLREHLSGNDVSYVFSDEQVRDFLREGLSLIRRKKLHGHIAQAIEKLYGKNIDEYLEQLASHYTAAGDLAKSADFSLRAGDRATNLQAPREAKRHYENALSMLGDERLSQKLEILSKLGDVTFKLAEFGESIQSYAKAVEVSLLIKQPKTTAQLYSKLGNVNWFNGDSQTALKEYKLGLDALKEEKDTEEEAGISQNIARLYLNSPGDAEKGIEWCEKAIQISKKLNNHEVLAHALQTLALLLKPNKENKKDILGYLENSLNISLENRLQDSACRAHKNLAVALYFIKSDYVRARDVLVKGVEYSKKTGYLSYEHELSAWLALFGHIPLGELDKALQVSRESLKISSEIGDVHSAYSLIPMGVVEMQRGNLGKAEEYLTMAETLAKKSSWTEVSCYAQLALGRLRLKQSRNKEAEEHLLAGLAASGERPIFATVELCFELVKASLALNELSKAEASYDKLRTQYLDMDEKGVEAYERWACGRIAASKADWNEAIKALRRSIDLWSHLGYLYNQSLAATEVGNVLLKSGNKDNSEKIMREARSVLERLGITVEEQ